VQQGESAHREGRHFVARAPESIRFVISTQDLELSSQYCTAVGDTRPDFQGATLTCAASDVLTAAKKDLLLNQVLPVALERLAARIKVARLTSNLMVGSRGCSGFTVPAAHKSTGGAERRLRPLHRGRPNQRQLDSRVDGQLPERF
jgi:hypothetical protein